MNRGSRQRPRSRPPAATGFNEAPIHESGKWVAAALEGRLDVGFNEAPIHESGKSLPARRSGRGLPRFNEAPIHESGKSQAQALRRAGRRLASMRPRFMNRGSCADTYPSDGAGDSASMRPRFMNRGSDEQPHDPAAGPDASMRPRFMNRGSSGRSDGAHRLSDASMRPRFMNRGSRELPFARRYALSGFNEAPIHESGKLSPLTPRGSVIPRFNEAPIHESGKSRTPL